MDGSLWTGIIILLAVAAAIAVLASGGGKRQRRKLVQRLTKMAAENGGNISGTEAWRYRAIGIDEARRRLYFINVYHASREEIALSLDEMKTCTLLKENVKGRQNAPGQNRRIEMELVSAQTGDVVVLIPFFDPACDNDEERDEAEKRAEKWKERVSKYMNKYK